MIVDHRVDEAAAISAEKMHHGIDEISHRESHKVSESALGCKFKITLCYIQKDPRLAHRGHEMERTDYTARQVGSLLAVDDEARINYTARGL